MALVGAWLVFFGPQLFSSSIPFFRDNLLAYLPFRQYLHQRLRAGELPEWFPSESMGVPLIGQIAVGTFHPATWLLLPFDWAVAVKLNLLLAYLAALIGAYRFARVVGGSRLAAVASAWAYGFGGYALGLSSLLPYTMSMATLPWLGWGLWKTAQKPSGKHAAIVALAWALIFLAGDPQGLLESTSLIPIALWCGAASWAARRRAAAWMATAGVTAGLLVCIEFLPARESFATSIRLLGNLHGPWRTFWSLHPARLLEFILPGFLDLPTAPLVLRALYGPEAHQEFLTTVFFGAVALALLALGVSSRRRGVWALLAVAVFATWLATGDFGHLLLPFQKVFSFMARFRFPQKYLAFFWVPAIPLIAWGLDEALRNARRALAVFGVSAALLAALTGALAQPSVVSMLWTARGLPPPDAEAFVDLSHLWSSGLSWSVAFLALAALIAWSAPRRPALWALLPLVLFAELLHGNGAHFPLITRDIIDSPHPFAREILNRATPGAPAPRVHADPPYTPEFVDEGATEHRTALTVTLSLYPAAAALYGVESLGVVLGAWSARFEVLFGSQNERVRERGGWANTCYRTERDRPDGAPVIASRAGLRLVSVPCRDRAFLAGADVSPDMETSNQWFASHGLDSPTVVWEGGPKLNPATGTVTWKTRRPEHVELEVEATAPAALVIGTEWSAGWSATVDDAPSPIFPTLIALQGVAVPEGRHRVVLEYHTPKLALGAALSGAGLLAVVAMWLSSRRRWNA